MVNRRWVLGTPAMKYIVGAAAMSLWMSMSMALSPPPPPAGGRDCPESVKSAARKSRPDAVYVSCDMESENGKTIYEVGLKSKDGKAIELEVTPDGSILETEETIELALVPNAIMRRAQAKYPSARPIAAEKVSKADGTVQFELTIALGKSRRELTFASATGKLLEDDADEDEYDSEKADDD